MAKIRRPGYANGRQKMDDALNNYQSAVDDYENDGYQKLGTDQGYDFESAGETELKNVKTDPKLKEAQVAALQDLRDRSKNGLTLQDKADLQAIQEETNSQNRGRQDALRSEFAARGGMGGSSEAVLRAKNLQAAQTAAARTSQAVAARTEQNRMNATQALGNQSGAMRDQDFKEQATAAEAQDRINQYNNAGRNQANRDRWSENSGRDRLNNQNYMGYQQNKMQANQGAAQVLYDSGVEDENRRMLEKQERERRRKAQNGAILGTAGAVVGGIYGGPAGAAAGASAGNSIGQAFAQGGMVQGPEVVAGDDPVNDVVDIRASAKEVVLPKSISKDPEAAAAFVKVVNEKADAEELVQALFQTIDSLTARKRRV